jgi:hypothetical protein
MTPNQQTGRGFARCARAGLAGAGLAAAVAVLPLLAGCMAYRVGNASLYDQSVQSVYVPIFESSSFRRFLGERLTEAVIKEIQLKTSYAVVGPDQADTILSGKITVETKRVLFENKYDEPRENEVALQVRVSWVDRNNNVIRDMRPIPLPVELVTITENATLVPEIGQSVSTAQQDAIKKLAQQIVQMMESPW